MLQLSDLFNIDLLTYVDKSKNVESIKHQSHPFSW